MKNNNESLFYKGYKLISRGINRVCVECPENKNICYKFEFPDIKRKQKKENIFTFFRRKNREENNFLEYKAHLKLNKILNGKKHERFPRCDGFVDTPIGQALAFEVVKDISGEVAKSVGVYAEQKKTFSLNQLCASIDELSFFLIENNIPLFDMNIGNLVVVNRINKPFLFIIDAKSIMRKRGLVSFSHYIPWLMHKKIRRRSSKLKRIISELWYR